MFRGFVSLFHHNPFLHLQLLNHKTLLYNSFIHLNKTVVFLKYVLLYYHQPIQLLLDLLLTDFFTL
jgi:hypothetical protein